eukprot:TRINITY_DN6381_c0_g2_i4.p2 TRINITY_DN6381_c0_g2~~TRINITY_DN6381_c0_g2_i4.p2  ORF type:complete len:152 (-),score=34.41 TRINITY_DN6381_c0_g2_i4:62-517(-)
MELLFDENEINVNETHKFISKGGSKKSKSSKNKKPAPGNGKPAPTKGMKQPIKEEKKEVPPPVEVVAEPEAEVKEEKKDVGMDMDMDFSAMIEEQRLDLRKLFVVALSVEKFLHISSLRHLSDILFFLLCKSYICPRSQRQTALYLSLIHI